MNVKQESVAPWWPVVAMTCRLIFETVTGGLTCELLTVVRADRHVECYHSCSNQSRAFERFIMDHLLCPTRVYLL